jgi:hypothetical protein
MLTFKVISDGKFLAGARNNQVLTGSPIISRK